MAELRWVFPSPTPAIQGYSLSDAGLARWVQMMKDGNPMALYANDLPPAERALLEAEGLAAYLTVPIQVNGLIWGYMGFASQTAHHWPSAQIDALITLTDAIGAAIQRHQTRQQLIQSEAEVRAILRAIPDPLLRIDRDGNYLNLYSAPESYRVFSYNQYLDNKVQNLWPKEFADLYVAGINLYLNRGSQEPLKMIFDMNLPHFGRCILEITSVRWDDNSVLSLGRDITQAKLADALIEASEAKFRAIYEGSPDVMLLVDAKTQTVLETNAALEHILQLDPQQTLYRPIQRLFRLADAALPAIYERVQAEGAAFGQTTVTTTSGQQTPLDVAAATLELASGPAILLIMRDTSDRVRATELNTLLEKERELNLLRQQFIQTVSHEFRTPLAIIQISAEMLHNYSDRLTEEQRQGRFDVIERQIEYMKVMVENVTRYGKVLQGIVLQPCAIDLATFFGTLVQDIDSLHPTPRIALVTKLATPTYYGDPDLLRQAVQNLINNALRYSKPEQMVNVWVNSDATQLVVRVADEGIGIPPEFLRHLFTPFKRAENAQGIGGTGIGLTITKRIVDQHGGHIDVESQVGQGTIVSLILPHDALPQLATPSHFVAE